MKMEKEYQFKILREVNSEILKNNGQLKAIEQDGLKRLFKWINIYAMMKNIGV